MLNLIDMDISSMLEVQVDEVKEVKRKKNVTSKDLIPFVTITPPPISQEESSFYKLMFDNDISVVRFRKLHCTACDVHIGSAPAEAKNMFEHPVLRTLLCANCREFYGDGTFEQGDDATDMFCRWCANGGNLYCCSYCSNTFCYKCIRRNFDSLVRKKIEADEKWKCFVCNPADLYATRATCWALLKYVQTVTRKLENDESLTPEELEERMNLDETECCPRRKKRKRKRTGSSDIDEDEDETYDPKVNNEPITTKRRVLKKRYKHRRLTLSNGSIPRLLPIRQCCPSSTENSPKPPELSTSLNSFTSVKTANTSAKSSNAFFLSVSSKTQENQSSPRPNQTVQEKVDAPNAKTYPSANITAVPTVKLLQSTAPFNPMQALISHVPNKNSYQTYYPASRMVTIPNTNHPMALTKSRVLLPKPKQTIKMMVTPSVINLDSDSDEPMAISVVNSPNTQNTPPVVDNNTTVNANSSSTVAVPVALVSTDSSCNINTIKINKEVEQPLRELDTTLNKSDKSLGQTVLYPYKEQFNDVFNNIKVKFNQILEDTKSEYANKNSIQETRYKIRSLYKEVYNTIIQMSYINDRVIRDYNSWERSQNKESEIIEERINRTSSLDKNHEIPLDMICAADSAEESDNEDVTTIKLSELILSTNALKSSSDNKKMVDQSVETSSVVCKDKSIQVFDFESKDYEKIIGHSVLTKTNNDSSTEEDSISAPVATSNEHVGKYEEQFINYLQHIEDHGIEIDDKSNEIVLESLIDVETDSSIPETLVNEIPSNNLSESTDLTLQENPEEHSKKETVNDDLMEVESLLSDSKSVSNNLRIKEIPINETNINTELEKEHMTMTNNTTDEKQNINIKKAIENVINSLITNETNVNNSTAEDDITIIED
ncbi:PREDICTED: uncharacterized protein LOC107067572 isoform X2 [Polistes dominula]|uniref:Uncharacterized protein LOC107067572 isoform X2 n=1 Tax=Polistes dominula TaxID=743375 RepID=A0ABM1IEN2_POLDO|nr:PREDICTED: uncharacterized protein LOC107067572 isoform X2 [Polistes dominula]